MLVASSNFPCRNAAADSKFSSSCNPIKFLAQIWAILVLILILASNSHAIAAPKRVRSENSANIPTHYNFLKGRRRVLICGNDPTLCMDPEKNPWGGTTCCFQKFCKDTRSDPRNCGGCGKTCAFGLICCDGRCVDIQNDPHHCGSCFEECPAQNRCSFAICGYG